MKTLLTPYKIDKTFYNDDSVEMVSVVDSFGAWVLDCFKSDADEILRRLNGFIRNNYPESLIRRNTYLERALSIHKEEIAAKDEYIHQLRFEVITLSQIARPDEETGRIPWIWQHDGYDFLRSMRNDQVISISAEDLRDLLANGEKVIG